MPRYVPYSDSETDYSETDESIIQSPRQRRTHIRRRSMSRHRRSPEYSNAYLSPVLQDVRVHRSASTGGRRPRKEPPAVMIDINNDVRNKGTNQARRTSQSLRETLEDEGELALRSHRRPRASTSVSRENSPRHHRDYELVMDQRLLEKNDSRQDLELMRHQQEIERLERELARRRGDQHQHHHRMHREEEEWFEDEIHDRLRRLDRLERKQRQEEEQRRAELQWRMKKYEEGERLAAEREEVKARLREEKLKEIQKEREEEEEKERIKQELRDEEARKKADDEEKRRKAIKMKQEAIEEWKLQEERRKLNEQKEKEEQDRLFRERLRCEFGYTEEEIEKILDRRKHADEKEERKEHSGGLVVKEKEYEKTTWIKV